MIDYINFINPNLDQTYIKESNFNFTIHNVNMDTGEIHPSSKKKPDGSVIWRTPYMVAEYKGLYIFCTDSNKLRIKGSFHKFWNNGLHNFNDFSESKAKNTIITFCKIFNINLDHSKIDGLEIGINIKIPMNVDRILDRCFLHKTTLYEKKYDNTNGHFIQFEHSHYVVKIYNKSLLYNSKGFNLDNNVLRFEIKYKKMEFLNNMGVFNLLDLMNFPFVHFKSILLKKWDEVLLLDDTIRYSNQKLEKLRYVETWTDLIRNKSRKTFYRYKNLYNSQVIENSERQQLQIRQIMEDKINILTNKVYNDHLSIWSI